MPAGLQIFNDGLYKQIDQDYFNFLMIASGTLTTAHDAAFAADNVESASVTVTGVNPIAVFSCPQILTLGRVANSGSSWTFYFLTWGVTHRTINYWIFDSAPQFSPTETFGLEVFKADGSRAFHSSAKALRVVDFFTVTPPTTTQSASDQGWAGVTNTYASSRTYGVVQANMFSRQESYNSIASYGPLGLGHKWMEDRNMRGGASIASNAVTATLNTLESYHHDALNATAETYSQWGEMSWLVVDVTNY